MHGRRLLLVIALLGPATSMAPTASASESRVSASPSEVPAPASPASSPAPAQGRVRFGAGMGTDVPMSLGVRAFVELPFRLRASTNIGYLPKFYSDSLNDLLVGWKVYPESTGDLIVAALKSSLVWRTHVGFRPFPKLGFYADAGYGLVTLGGGASSGELISGITGIALPNNGAAASLEFDIASTLHMIDVEIGYEHYFWERLQVRAAIGGAFTVGASTKVKPSNGGSSPAMDQFCRGTAKYLVTTYKKYVHTPVISLGVGYSF